MGKPDPAATVASELRLLLRSYPEVSLADLATALQPAAPSAPGDASWESRIEPILRCAAAFGDARQFPSKRAALRILAAELGVPESWTNLHWNQLPPVAAAALLPRGPERALDLMQRHRLVPPPTAPDHTVETTVGIIRADRT